jgi:CTP:molybdopterin cytidylyltransferase MocA
MMEQDGDEGAKKLTRKYKEAITFINLGDAIDDIDTPGAFAKAVSRQS